MQPQKEPADKKSFIVRPVEFALKKSPTKQVVQRTAQGFNKEEIGLQVSVSVKVKRLSANSLFGNYLKEEKEQEKGDLPSLINF